MKRTIVPYKEQLLAMQGAVREILSMLYWFPEMEFTLSELASKAGVSKSTVSRLLPSMEALEIVNVVKKGNIFGIKANAESVQFRKRKLVYNLEFLFESGLVEYLKETFKHSKAIVLIGSYRKGEDISTSDIDMAIETVEDSDIAFIRPKGLERYERHFSGRKIQLMLFNRKRIDLNVFNSIANGIVLDGFLEVRS